MREFADLVEEDGAAIGDLQAALPLCQCPGKSSFLVAEELAFNQGFGERRTVDGDEGTAGAGAVKMNGARRKLFAGAALSRNQNCGIAGCNLRDELIDLAHQGTLTDHVVLDVCVGEQS